MTSPQLGLFPARSDDRLATLAASQLAAGGSLEFGQRVRAEVRERVALEPGPQVFDRVEIWRVGRQQCHLNRAFGAVEVLANDATLLLSRAVPDDQEFSPE